MSAPALVFILIALLAVATLGLRRRAFLPFAIAGISSALIGLFVLYAPLDTAISLLGTPLRLDSTWQILGRPLSLDPQNRAGVGFLFLVGALFFGAGWAAAPGRSFVPAGLIGLGLLAGALTIEPFLFAAIFLELAAMACVLILIPPGSRSERGVLNLLVLYSMAMMAILFTGWLLENVGVTSVTPELALRVVLLLGLGFVILIFVPPFHYWLPSVAQRVNPYSLAFVAIILQSSGMFFLLRFLDNFAWMRADPRVSAAIQAAGVLMIVFGTLVAITQISFLKIAAYALLADIGVSLLAIGSELTVGTEIAIGLTSARVISLGLWGLGAALMSKSGYSRGAGRKAPLATAAGLVGVMSLSGLPLTAGFPWRWTLLTQLPEASRTGVSLMLLSMLAILWAVLRWARVLFELGSTEADVGEDPPRTLAVALMASACLLLGIFPQLAIPWVAQATAGLANLSP
ncbi:MAG: proton-conducting transporter membrane subunit [Anaerolineales bacterium]